MVGADHKAKAAEWGEDTDTTGTAVIEMAARLGLIVLNRGNVTTFRRPGYRQTIVDVTLASEGVARKIVDWRVLEDFTASDHQYISFMVQSQIGPQNKQLITKDARLKPPN